MMTWVISAVAFLVLLTVLVLLHELGHFILARATGVNVEEFGIGLPPKARGLFHWKGTLFSLNWVPFGGFVRLQGENSMDPEERMLPGSFAHAPIRSRLAILLAGVFMNLLLASILFFQGFWFWNWMPTYFNLDEVREASVRGEIAVDWGLYISDVIPETPAAEANVTVGAILRAVDGQRVETINEVLALQKDKRSVLYTLLLDAGKGEEVSLRVPVTQGKTGVAISEYAVQVLEADRSMVDAVFLSMREIWTVTVGTVQGIGRVLSSLVTQRSIPENITGVVGIAHMTHASLQEGMQVYLRLVALLSLSLAVLNILPFPALDGGRAIFVLYELFTGVPFNRKLEVVINSIGILLIMLLMAMVTWNDIVRIVESGS